MLKVSSLIKEYRNRRVVNGVSLEVNNSEIVGLLGPNGAGKTTTFYMIVGLISPYRGNVYYKDTDITNLPMHKRAALGLDNTLSHNEGLKLQMSKRWTRGVADEEKPILSRIITYLIYAIFIGGSIYFILFTNIIEKMLSTFGVTN